MAYLVRFVFLIIFLIYSSFSLAKNISTDTTSCRSTFFLKKINTYKIKSTLIHKFGSDKYKSSYISSDEILNLISSDKKENEEVILIDLRAPKEINQTGIIHTALIKNYFDSDFDSFVEQLEKEKSYIVYCKSGFRSAKAAKKFRKKNLKVRDYSEGMDGWLSKKLATYR